MNPAVSLPSPAFLKRPKPLWRMGYDLMAAPLRMALLPDAMCEKAGLTSLRAERFSVVLPVLKGRVLDIGAGYNELIQLYRAHYPSPEAEQSVGVDVVDWGSGCTLIKRSDKLPFPDASFDTVSYVACINHIPERAEALKETRRVLKPGGRVVLTMIGRFIGTVGHALWWYSEDKHRDVDVEEEMGLDRHEMIYLLEQAGFKNIRTSSFCYGLNTLYLAGNPT